MMTLMPQMTKPTSQQAELIFGPDVGVPYDAAPSSQTPADRAQIKEAENEGLAPVPPHDPDLIDDQPGDDDMDDDDADDSDEFEPEVPDELPDTSDPQTDPPLPREIQS